jgi:hypothetical protein
MHSRPRLKQLCWAICDGTFNDNSSRRTSPPSPEQKQQQQQQQQQHHNHHNHNSHNHNHNHEGGEREDAPPGGKILAALIWKSLSSDCWRTTTSSRMRQTVSLLIAPHGSYGG